MFRPKLNIFLVFLLLLISFSLVPLLTLTNTSIDNLDSVKSLSTETIVRVAGEESNLVYKSRSMELAQRISEFLRSCELDLEMLAQLPKNPGAYQRFSHINRRHLKATGQAERIYREIAFIDQSGREMIKVVNDKIIPPEQLTNVSLPANTTYLSETYFNDIKTSDYEIFVTHLTGWYVSRPEQLQQSKIYDGVIRFCKKYRDKNGNFAGIYMIALDHRHIMNFIIEVAPDPDSPLLDNYRQGNYTYLLDDEAWVIAHPKLWDIRGLDKNGKPVPPYTESTSQWAIDAGMMPLNMMLSDWRLSDIHTQVPISSLVERARRGETVFATWRSLGISGETRGVVRTRVFSPIFYETGAYSRYGVFGIIVMGTAVEDFLKKTNQFTTEIEQISDNTKTQLVFIAIIMSLAIVFFSFFIARNMSRTIRKINQSLLQIGQKEYTLPNLDSPITEIAKLSSGVRLLANQLAEKDRKIARNIQELEIVNQKLAETKNELDSYWRHEYEYESDIVLEEKIQSYEKAFPKLKEIRRQIYLGNSVQILRVLRQVIPQSQMSMPTWISGESGVGKTALARTIHMLSPRCDTVFQVFAASEFAATDPMIVMGKLFGYGPGHGIRGIDKAGQKGILQNCHGGVLFIDDVDALPMETQAQLLRVVDGLDFRPAAGKSENINVDVRFLFATHVDLEERVKQGSFRKDLFRRMGGNYNKILIPPLRERKSDIPMLADFYLERYCERFDIKLLITNTALNLLQRHDYIEGNIGELRMLIELACENARIDGDRSLEERHFPAILTTAAKVKRDNNTAAALANTHLSILSEKERRHLQVLQKNMFRMEASETELGYKKGSRTLSHHLRGISLKLLVHCNWNIDEACEHLAGNDNNRAANTLLLRQRLEGYIKNLTSKSDAGTVESLYKNLPKAYHTYVTQTIQYFRRQDLQNPTASSHTPHV